MADFTENQNLNFKCKVCDTVIQAPFKKITNLNKHLKTHEILKDWFKNYNKFNRRSKKNNLTDKELSLIKWIVCSNQSFNQLKIPYLRDIICEAMETKLRNAVTISLIVDTWTNTLGSEFLALSAVITNNVFEKEYMVIGFVIMHNGHSAERIKESIESIVNSYKFDKSNISCK